MATITGTSGSDTISPLGNSGGVTGGLPSNANDTISGAAGNDIISASGGTDVIDGGADTDALDYSARAEVLTLLISGTLSGTLSKQGVGTDSFASIETFYLGPNNDTVLLQASGSGSIYLDLGAGSNNVTSAYNSPFTISYYQQAAGVNGNLTSNSIQKLADLTTDSISHSGSGLLTLQLTVNDDTMLGSGNREVLEGEDGNDNLAGLGGNDTLYGSGGNDTLAGGDGNDGLYGGDGNDILYGSGGEDAMFGGAGDDQVVVNETNDVAQESAGEGTDTLWSGAATYQMGVFFEIGRLFGSGSNLSVTPTQGPAVQLVVNPGLASTISGGLGADVLWGGTSGSVLNGGGGADTLRDQLQQASMSGGAGDDQYTVGNINSTVTELASEGTDTVWLTVNDWVASTNIEIIRLSANALSVQGSASNEQIVANPTQQSTLRGGGGDDVLWGGSALDSLYGEAGDDIFRGQGAADRYYGGVGNDQYVVLNAGTEIFEDANEGYDTAWIGLAANTTFTLATNVERGNLGGAANRLTGNALDNVLVGDAVASTLSGAGGNDIIFASAFADTLSGGNGDDDLYTYGGTDRLLYAGTNLGVDRVVGFAQGSAKLDFTGSGVTFGQLTLTNSGGNTTVAYTGTSITVFGVILGQSDFIFG